MNADDIEKAKSKIHKLLALSKSSNENEAALSIEKVNVILRKLNISSIEEACLIYKEVRSIKTYSKWRSELAYVISQLYCTHSVIITDTNKRKFYGEDLDVFMSCETFSYLQKTIKRIARLKIHKNAKTPFRESYKSGVVYGLQKRFYADPNIAWHSQERKTKKELVDNYCSKQFELGKYRKNKTNSTAFDKGYFDSESIALNRQVAEERLGIGG